jgi:hypothetical protein
LRARQTKVLFGGVVVIVAILIAFVAFSSLNRPGPTSQSGSVTSSSTTSAGWRVVGTNITLSDHSQMTPCALFDESCIAGNLTFFTNGATINLLNYGGNYYYMYNYTHQSEQQPPPTSIVWFNNSTLFCVSPKFETYSTCPA